MPFENKKPMYKNLPKPNINHYQHIHAKHKAIPISPTPRNEPKCWNFPLGTV